MTYASSSKENISPRATLRRSFYGAAFGALFATSSYAQSNAGLDKTAFTLHVAPELSFLAHRSDTMNATDFATEYGFTISSWAGKKKNFGLSISQRQLATSFTQASSSAQSSWTDASLYYRLLWFYPHISLGHCTLGSKRDGVELVDALCNTAGAGLDLRLPAGSMAVARMEVKSTTVLEVRDRLGNLDKVGPVERYEVGMDLYPKMNWVSFMVGFRYRSYQLEVAGSTYKEIETGPYVGADLHWDW